MSLCKIGSVGATAKIYFGNSLLNSVTNSATEGFFFRQTSAGEHFNPSRPTMYDSRKYSHHLPTNCVITPFEPLSCFPTGIFRCTSGEILGQGAGKCAQYQNPEYFSFHHMTFFDMHLLMRCFRLKCADTKRKPN